MARDKSKDSYTFSLSVLKGKAKQQKLKALERPIRSIEMVHFFKKCIRKAIRVDGWEGEQPTTVGDPEPDDWPDYELEEWPEEWNRIKDDESHPRYGIFWRCVWRNIRRIRRIREREDYPRPRIGRRPPRPTSPISPPAPPIPAKKKYGYTWLLLLTDDLVDMGITWLDIKLLLNNLIRNNDDLIHIRFEGTVTSMRELDLITKKRHGPRVGLINFTEGVNTRDRRIVFELQVHPGLDKNGKTVEPNRPEVYLHGLP